MKTFARVADGKIVEYPVYEIHIRNRAHPLAWYTECVYDVKPEVLPFHYTREMLRVSEGKVYVSYVVEAQSLDNLLSSLRSRVIPGIPTVEITIDKLDKEYIDRVVVMAKQEVQAKLDAFAATDGFDDMKSLVGYVSSTIPDWVTKATRGILLRDQTWIALYTYLDGVLAGTTPLPTTAETILEQLPALTWE